MALAGCAGVFVGFESLTDENLVHARKRTPRAEDYGRRVRIFHEHGIKVNGSFMVGFDGDRKDTFVAMAQWIEAHAARLRHVSHPDAVPGHAAVPATGGRGAAAAPQLGPLRHRARRLSAEAPHARRTRAGLRLAVPAAVLARVDLEAPARGGVRVAGVLRRGVPLQALEPFVALPDRARARASRLAPARHARRRTAPPPPPLPGGSPVRRGNGGPGRRWRGGGAQNQRVSRVVWHANPANAPCTACPPMSASSGPPNPSLPLS